MQELYKIFTETLQDFSVDKIQLQEHMKHRGSIITVTQEIEFFGFNLTKNVSDNYQYKFFDSAAVFDHHFLRMAFRPTWQKYVDLDNPKILGAIMEKIDHVIQRDGVFSMSIPIVYLQFEKEIQHNETRQ